MTFAWLIHLDLRMIVLHKVPPFWFCSLSVQKTHSIRNFSTAVHSQPFEIFCSISAVHSEPFKIHENNYLAVQMKFDLLAHLLPSTWPKSTVKKLFFSCCTSMLLSRCSREEGLILYFCNGRFYISDDLSARLSARMRKCHKSDRSILKMMYMYPW